MTFEVKEPTQVFCSCGEPLELWNVPHGHTALPIEWVENGCDKCKKVVLRKGKEQ